MPLSEKARLVIASTTASWHPAEPAGLTILPLFQGPGESVALERLDAGAARGESDFPGGEEIFILSGDLRDDYGTYDEGTWIRNPAGVRRSLGSTNGAAYWVKRGHLHAAA